MEETKVTEKHFRDWYQDVLGYGYGTGEEYTLPALRGFFEILKDGRSYEYKDIEKKLGGLGAWLLIGVLCGCDIIEYGCSPRYGWITPKGEKVRDFVLSKSELELFDIAMLSTNDVMECYPNACNCGEHGYEEGKICDNPLWTTK